MSQPTARITAFGSTRRKDTLAADDPNLQALADSFEYALLNGHGQGGY